MSRTALLTVAIVCGSLLLTFESSRANTLSDEVRDHIKNRIPASEKTQVVCRAENLCGSKVLPRFYQAQNFYPAWSNENGIRPASGQLVDAIRGADLEGLNPRDYHLSVIESLLEKTRRDMATEDLTDLDLLLTDAFLLYSSHLSTGRVNPETIQAEWFIKTREVNLVEALFKGLEEDQIQEALEHMRPPRPEYAGLKQALAQYEDLMEKGGWPTLPPGPKMEKGTQGKRVAALRSRLVVSGDMEASGAADPELFDEALHQAVQRMQKRHGLEVDGVVGPATLAALNVSVVDRIRQIEVNLERWRWLPRTFGQRYLHVNIANFELDVIEDDQPVMTMRVVVGKKYRRTPVFAGTVKYLELNPYWNVPPSIAKKDIARHALEDPQYLEKKNIRVFESWAPGAREIDPCDVNWARVKEVGCSFKLRQDPGPKNALGTVKFMFPNKYDVYLHDTSHPELFNKTKRSYSSGCVRVEKPIDLATYLLQGNPEWTREHLLAAVDSRETQKVSLPEPIPVLILYFTAWVDRDGNLQFREDIYERDDPLYQALTEGPPKS